MPTNAEIKALIDTRVRAQRSHILHDGVAEILDFMVDNIAAGGGGSQGIDSVLAVGQLLTADRTVNLNDWVLRFIDEEEGYDILVLYREEELGTISMLQSVNNLAGGNYSQLIVSSSETDAITTLQSRFNADAKTAKIVATSTVTDAIFLYQADTHNFATGDMIITDLAGGGTTGLSIDNDGKIIRTP